MCQHLRITDVGKATGGHAMVANRTREIRPSGMTRGAWGLRLATPSQGGNVTMETGLRSISKGVGTNPPAAYGARAPALSRPPKPRPIGPRTVLLVHAA